jgi:glycerophosphoryl diester phosphodiesterase
VCAALCSAADVSRHAIMLPSVAGMIAANSRSHGAQRLTVVAHRGASAVAPENTPAAFRMALALGADVLETDVRATRDGELVLLHDATLERIAGRPERVEALTWDELREIPVAVNGLGTTGAGEREQARVCRLDEVYPLLGAAAADGGHRRGETRLLLDLKSPVTYAAALARSITQAGVGERVILGVRSADDLRAVTRELPGVMTLGFGSGLEAEWQLAEAGVDVLRLWSRWLDGGTLTRAREYGRPIWTIGGGSVTGAPPGAATEDELLTYRRLGLDGVLVNDVALAVRANRRPL